MKRRGNGQARVISQHDLQCLFTAFECPRDRALFGICLHTACRISEALALDTYDIQGNVIVFRKSITKGKLRTRTVAINSQLQSYLRNYTPQKAGPLFPGRWGRDKRLRRSSADAILRNLCKKLHIDGVSTHSFRRTALTQMVNAGIPLSHIQKISGHSDLGTLQRYLAVDDNQIALAVSKIGF